MKLHIWCFKRFITWFFKAQTVIIEKKHANVKEVINSVELYSLVNREDGKGNELCLAELPWKTRFHHCYSPGTGFQHACSLWRDFTAGPSLCSGPRTAEPPFLGTPTLLLCHTDSSCLACPRSNISTLDLLFFQYLLPQFHASNIHTLTQAYSLTLLLLLPPSWWQPSVWNAPLKPHGYCPFGHSQLSWTKK